MKNTPAPQTPSSSRNLMVIGLVYFAVSSLVFASGFVQIGKIADISVSPMVLSLILLIPVLAWYELFRRKQSLSSNVEISREPVWFETLIMFLLSMIVRLPLVLYLGMAYEKTPVVYLVILVVALVDKNSLSVLGLKTKGFTRSLAIGLVYYLALAVPMFIVFFVLTFALSGRSAIVGYDPAPALLVFPFMTFCVGISEEGLFRGLMQTRLSKVHGERKALLIQALLFGVWHFVWHLSPLDFLGMAVHISTSFAFGLVFGLFYKESGNLIPLILAHGLVDTIGYGFIPNLELESMETIVQGVQALSFAVGMLVLLLCTRPLAKAVRPGKEEHR